MATQLSKERDPLRHLGPKAEAEPTWQKPKAERNCHLSKHRAVVFTSGVEINQVYFNTFSSDTSTLADQHTHSLGC